MEGALAGFVNTLQELRDILLFRRLIGTELLIGIYYLGAVGAPMVAWQIARRLRPLVRPADGAHGWNGQGPTPVDPGVRRRLWALAIAVLLLLEILWRLAFEFGIAYFQIRDALTRP
jgi:hypothetical protein